MRNRFMIVGFIVILTIGLMVGSYVIRNNRLTGQEIDLSGIPVEGKTIGASSAPVLIEVYSDYQCPWCAKAALSFEKGLIKDYVVKGQARLQFRDFPFVGWESYWAAMAAGCAAQQNQFWAYHDKLFREQKGENQGHFTKEHLREWAVELGLDTVAFDRCFVNGEPSQTVRDDYQSGVDQGVNSTPTFFFNGRKVLRIPSAKEVRTIMKEELSKKQ